MKILPYGAWVAVVAIAGLVAVQPVRSPSWISRHFRLTEWELFSGRIVLGVLVNHFIVILLIHVVEQRKGTGKNENARYCEATARSHDPKSSST